MSVNNFNKQQFDGLPGVMTFEFFDAAGAIIFPYYDTVGSTVLTFNSYELTGTIDEIDQAETEIFKSQSGNAFAGIKPNPRAFRFSIAAKEARSWGMLRELLRAITAGYRCRWVLNYNLLHEASLNTFNPYTVTFDPCVVEIKQPEYRKNKRGFGLKLGQSVEFVVYESTVAALPDTTNATESGGVVTEVQLGRVKVIKLVETALPIS